MGKKLVARECNMGTMTVSQKKNLIKSALRKISMYWKPIIYAKKIAKVSRSEYTYDVPIIQKDKSVINFKYTYKADMYKCACCGQLVPDKIPKYIDKGDNSFDLKKNFKLYNNIEVDHINSVVEEVGVTDWNSIINNLFEEDINKYQLLCKACHKNKTLKMFKKNTKKKKNTNEKEIQMPK